MYCQFDKNRSLQLPFRLESLFTNRNRGLPSKIISVIGNRFPLPVFPLPALDLPHSLFIKKFCTHKKKKYHFLNYIRLLINFKIISGK